MAVITTSPINRIAVEDDRISGVPVDTTTVINQGDMVLWNSTTHLATSVANDNSQADSTSAAAQFIGISNDTQPITSLNIPLPGGSINVVNRGLARMIIDDNSTYYPGDPVTIGNNAQMVHKTAASTANTIGYVAPENWAGAAQITAGSPDSLTGIVATQYVTQLLIALRPQSVNLSSL